MAIRWEQRFEIRTQLHLISPKKAIEEVEKFNQKTVIKKFQIKQGNRNQIK